MSESIRSRLVGWPPPALRLPCALGLVAVLAGSFAPTVAALIHRWWREPDYLYAFLVPPLAAVLLYSHREVIWAVPRKACIRALPVLGACLLTEGVAIYFQWRWIAGLSLIVGLAAAAALFWGTQRLQRGWPVLVCLLFMVPLPDLLATVLGAPLQDIGGKLSAFLLRTLGVRAVLMGRVVMIHELDLRMSEIFAGLQMFMAFCALGFTALCMPQFSRAVKVVLALSLVPLALAVNVVRVVLAGLLFGFGFPYLAETILSGFPQCLLLPLAAVLFWAELKLLDWLWTGPRDALDSIDEQYYSG